MFALVAAALVQVARAEEEEKASPKDIAIAATLIGAVAFQMGLFHLTNHSDKDMRKYTYQVINQTVSIFCAVLMFSTFNDVVQEMFLDGTSPERKFLVNMAHMLVWFILLQVLLAWVCGVIGKEPESIEEVEADAKCFGTLLAHITGFASINAWGSLQQIAFFSATPAHAFLIIPISFVGQFLLQRSTDTLRWKVAMADGETSEFEEKWDEETEEAENDIMGLTLSFNMIQVVRYANSNYLPDEEGQEPMDILAGHTPLEIHRLWASAVIFLISLCIMNYFAHPAEEGHGHGGHGEGEHGHAEGHGGHGIPGGHADGHSPGGHSEGHSNAKKSFFEELKERSWEVMMLALTMGFAWCCFYSARMSLASIELLQDNMVLAMALTLSISLVSFGLIRVLDLIADLDSTGPRVDHTIFQIIRALGLLVGFGWEQTFDQAVESISSSIARPHLAKFVLAAFCVIVIVPAWYKYILPMAISDCWEWGFLVHNLDDPLEQERWQRVAEHIEEKRKKSAQKNAEEGGMQSCYVRLTGNEAGQIVELQNENIRLRGALEKALLVLKDKEDDEFTRASNVQADIQQMDGMVGHLRTAEQVLHTP